MAPFICPSCGRNLSEECRCPTCGATSNSAAKIHIEPITLSPEMLEIARQQFNEQETLAGIEEIERTGGLRLEDFIQELEAETGFRE